jgi:tetratricopeptide (TPR) repeat protein
VTRENTLASGLNHLERYDEVLEQYAEAARRAPRSFSLFFILGNRCWALYGLGRLEEALAAVDEAIQMSPTWSYMLSSRVVILQALGRSAEAQDAIRRARKALPGGGLDLWLDRLRGSHMAPAMFQSFSQHFTDAWNATPEDAS